MRLRFGVALDLNPSSSWLVVVIKCLCFRCLACGQAMAGELEPKTSKPAGAQPVGGWRSGMRFRAGLTDLAGLVLAGPKVMSWAKSEAQRSASRQSASVPPTNSWWPSGRRTSLPSPNWRMSVCRTGQRRWMMDLRLESREVSDFLCFIPHHFTGGGGTNTGSGVKNIENIFGGGKWKPEP